MSPAPASRRFVAPPPEGPLPSISPPTFSVTIAAYQAAATIREAVESILEQTLPAHEIIVCDDGSTDDIAGALLPYRERIQLIRKPHRGVAAARNTALRIATGEFVLVHDADDVYLPERIEALTELAVERPDLDILTTDAYVEMSGEILGRYYRGTARFAVDDQRRAILDDHFIFGLAALRRERLLELGGFDESFEAGSDTDCHVRMILAGARAGVVDEPLVVRRILEGSLNSNRARSFRAHAALLRKAGRQATLDPGERSFLEQRLRVIGGHAVLASAEAAVRGLEPHPRRRALAVTYSRLPPGYGAGTRARALAAALLPRLARRRFERRERETGFTFLRAPSTTGR